MRKWPCGTVLTVLAVAAGSVGGALAADSAEVDVVKAVVTSAYVGGVHRQANPALMRGGFHPDFRMYVLRDGKLDFVTLEEWAQRIVRGAQERKGPAPKVDAEFAQVDVTGSAAVVRLELTRDGKHAFTDYLSLYKLPEGWRIVAKTFQAY
jgi:hypothetical protein